ncbi:hypothetical protein [Gluconobacter sp. P1C6_b]|uniref:hypothetical protein n=1 Tax=Gluconobacter sp. P1C6_b TaxID=2762619 RepID=UPI001C04609D|nr:hypothetical protein [Gluconobacter sp. P1C6_b]
MSGKPVANDNDSRFMAGRLCARKSWPDIGAAKIEDAVALAYRSGQDAFGDGWVVELRTLAEKSA